MRSGATPETSYLSGNRQTRWTYTAMSNSSTWDEKQDAHDREDASLLLCCFHDSIPDLIPNLPDTLIALLHIALTSEALQKRTIHTMHSHPVKVSLHRLRVARREQECLFPISMLQAGSREELRRGVFRHIRPEINIGTTAVRDRVTEPVEPTMVSRANGFAVPGTSKPALVANKKLVMDS